MDAMLKVEGINVYYGAIHAIKDVSFHQHIRLPLPCLRNI